MHILCKKIKEDILALTYSLLFRHSDRPDNYEIPVSSDIEVRLSTFSQLQQGSFYSVSCCFWVDICQDSAGNECCDRDGGGMGDIASRHLYWIMRTSGGRIEKLTDLPQYLSTVFLILRFLGRLRSLL